MNRPNYNQLFDEALKEVINLYAQGKLNLLNEDDLKGYLFAQCITLMEQKGFQTPFKIHAEKRILGKEVDLSLGDDDVLVELKFEPHWDVTSGQGRVFVRETEGSGSIEADLKKLEMYARNGKQGHFVMIDENDWHSNKIKQGSWQKIDLKPNSILLHVYQSTANV